MTTTTRNTLVQAFSKMSAEEKQARLHTLSDGQKISIFESIALAESLLSDKEWVTRPTGGGGDYGTALDRLESSFFGHLCGAITLPDMLELIQEIPDEAKWKRRKYNLKAMVTDLKDRKRQTRETEKRVNVEEHERSAPGEGEDPVKTREQELFEENKVLRAKVREQDEIIKDLKKRNRKLTASVNQLQAAFTNLSVLSSNSGD